MLLLWLLLVGVARPAPQADSSSTAASEDHAYQLSFPKDFIFSTATASYQVEGAWNVSGKTNNRTEMDRDVSQLLLLQCSSY